jgi:riboflavin biosynthesis pyrimidine reductase
MKFSTLTLATGLVAASFGTAFADTPDLNAQLVPAAEAQAVRAVVVEGRQATPVASFTLTDAERMVIDQNRQHR